MAYVLVAVVVVGHEMRSKRRRHRIMRCCVIQYLQFRTVFLFYPMTSRSIHTHTHTHFAFATSWRREVEMTRLIETTAAAAAYCRAYGCVIQTVDVAANQC